MSGTSARVLCAFLTVLIATVLTQAQGGEYVGTWAVGLGPTVRQNHTYSNPDRNTVQRDTSTTLGTGADGMGTLVISADGKYRLQYMEYELIYKKPVIAGTWRPVAKGGLFTEMNAIELIDAKPDFKYPEAERKWYVFKKEDGSFEARYPPYDGYAKIQLKRAGKAGKVAAKNLPTERSPAPVRTGPSTVSSPAPAEPRTWTPDAIRQHLTGKTRSEVIAILGRPVKSAYGTDSFNGVEKIFPPCPNGCNYRSFAISYGGPGGTVNSIELQYWIVEP